MIHISIEIFKLLLNKINQIENKNVFIIIIICDALLSIGASNEKIQDHNLHLCDTDIENTSVLVNDKNISLLFLPDTFVVIIFAWALQQALVYCVRLNAEPFSCTDSKHRRAILSRGSTDRALL